MFVSPAPERFVVPVKVTLQGKVRLEFVVTFQSIRHDEDEPPSLSAPVVDDRENAPSPDVTVPTVAEPPMIAPVAENDGAVAGSWIGKAVVLQPSIAVLPACS